MCLGERFFDPNLLGGYNELGGDQTSTIIHEYFHLAVVGNGVNLKEADLNKAAEGNFDEQIREKCGP